MRQMIAALLAVLLLTGPALAADETDSLVADAIGADALADGLPDSAAEFLEGITATDPGDLGDGISQIFTKALAQSGGAVRTALGTMALLLTILVLCAVVRELGGGDAVRLAGTLTMTAACTGSLRTMIGLGQETLEDVTAFTNLLLPTLAAATAATGAVGTSAAQYTASVFFADVLLTAISRVLLPLVYGFVALAAADAALGNRMLRGLGELLRSVVSGGLKGILFVFTAYLSITGLISGSADATTVRAAKLALSAAVPVVGSMLSDASETVLVSASLLRTSVGVFGMLAVLAICVVPVLRIAVQYLALKLTAALGGVLDDGTLAGLVESLASAMGMVLAMTASCALLLLICCVCAMKAVQL